MTSQEAILDKERRSRDWALKPSNIKKFGRWAWNDQGSRKWTTSQMEEKRGDCGLLATKQRKCFKEKVIKDEKGCCVNYVRNTKQDADLELAMGLAAQSSLVTFTLQRCLGNVGGKAWLWSSSENGGKTLEATADLRRGTLWKTVLQLEATRRICDKEK